MISKTMFGAMIAAAVAVTAAGPVVAADVPPQAVPTDQAASKPAKAKKVCRSESATGSIMPRRTCRTKAEWDALTTANRGAFEDARRRQDTDQMVQGSGR